MNVLANLKERKLNKLLGDAVNRRALAACALTAGVVLLGSGTASAADVYGAGKYENYTGQQTTIKSGDTVLVEAINGTAVTTSTEIKKTGSQFNVMAGAWDNIYGGYVYGYNYTSGADVSTIDERDYTVTSNNVFIQGGENANVYGGYVATDRDSLVEAGDGRGLAISNRVIISGGENKYVYGGAVYRGTVNGNAVEISGGTVTHEIYGGKMEASANNPDGNEGTANENAVIISGGTIGGTLTSEYSPKIYGAYSRHTNTGVNGNKVTISQTGTTDTTVSVKEIYGGYANDRGIAVDNKVEITGGTVTVGSDDIAGSVIGGNATGFADDTTTILKDNSVTMSAGTVYGSVYGGVVTSNMYIDDKGNTRSLKDVSGNTVSLSGNAKVTAKESTDGKDAGSVGGAKIDGTSGNVTGNTVTINGTTVNATIFGAQAGDSNNVTGNTVTIDKDAKDTKATIVAPNIYGAKVNGAVTSMTSNAVSIANSDVTVSGIIAGASIAGSGIVKGNSATIGAGVTLQGSVAAVGLTGTTGITATGNVAKLSAGSTVTNAYGVYVDGGTLSGQTDTKALKVNVTNTDTDASTEADVANTIVIANTATVSGGIYGVYGAGDATISNNTVTLDATGAGTLTNVYGVYGKTVEKNTTLPVAQ